MEQKESISEAGAWRQGGGRVLSFALLAAALIATSFCKPLREFFSFDHIRSTTAALGPFGPLAIIAFGVVSPLLFLPRWPLAVVSGLLYGVTRGVVLATFASSLGALLQFFLARSLLAGTAARLLAKSSLADMRIRPNHTFAAIFLLRAFPLSSFVVTNLMAGALRLPAASYLIASFLGMLPSSYMFAACGKFVKHPSPKFLVPAFLCVVLVVLGSVFVRRRGMRWIVGDTDKRQEKS